MTFYRAAPGGVPTQVAFSQRSRRYPTLDLDRANGCIRDKEHAYSKGRRPGRALRQHRREGLHRQDRRRR
jgi:hypothetical protein